MPRNPFFLTPCGHLDRRHVLLVSQNIVFPEGVAPGALLLKRGVITRTIRAVDAAGVAARAEAARTADTLGAHIVDVGDLLVSPGVVDLHMHMDEPGRMAWEGLRTGTRAAAAGGVTTLVDMPLNCKPAITSLALMNRKLSRVWVRLGCLRPWPQNIRIEVTIAGGGRARSRDCCALPCSRIACSR